MTTRPLVRIDEEKLAWAKEHDPETYREVIENLAELDRLVEDNPLQVFYPHEKQKTFLASRDPVKAFLGGNRSGKTTAGIVDDLIQAVDEECLPKHLKPYKRWQPPFHCRIVTPDFTSTMEGVVFEKLRELAPKHQLLGGAWDKAYDKQLRILRFQNGSRFQFLTFEQDLDKHGGAALHQVHYDEEPPEQIRKENQARLIDHAGQELFSMTPLLGMSWMYDSIYERRDQEGVTVVQVATDENPHLNQEAMDQFFSSLTPEEKEARREGKFVHFGGLVLSGFGERNLVDPVEPSHLKGQSILVGIDPGIVRGAVVWVAFDKDDHALVFDELYPQNEDASTIAGLIKEKNRLWGIKPDYVIDPSGRNRSVAGHSGIIEEFAAQGIYCAPGMNGRKAGILQMRRRIHADPPALLISRDCTSLLWEIKRWRVDEDEDTDKGKANETGDTFKTAGPDHLCDSLRYALQMHYFGPPGEVRPKRPSAFTPDYEGPYRPIPQPETPGVMGVYA